MRLLLVEDSDRLRRSLWDGLQKSGYAVDVAADGEDGLHLACTESYDVIVLDIMLPKIDGLELLRRLRAKGKDTHVLLLTARDSVPDRVTGLRAGADDYLIKPFAFEELLARVEALARRQHHRKQPRIRVGQLEIDLSAKTVRRSGAEISLAPREYALLEFLALRSGEVVSRTEIESHIYDMHADLMSNVVDSAICALRRKIDPANGPSFIQTRRGMGYVLQQESL
ncbi:MAG TPA: response regulator transcription factor [Tepidisphaeraceae bacterium]|nr:response regulator transcription factor [Tepidisphaeraceae bacterium]